jgi:hypothetical protein
VEWKKLVSILAIRINQFKGRIDEQTNNRFRDIARIPVNSGFPPFSPISRLFQYCFIG